MSRKRHRRKSDSSPEPDQRTPELGMPAHGMPAHRTPLHDRSGRGTAGGRIPILDAVRGLAIALMLIDHAAASWFDAKIATSDIRFWTRFSLPLFCVLMGYLISSQPRLRWRRLGEIVAASIAVNLIYWPMHQELEVLASLAITQVLAALLMRSPFAIAAGPMLIASLALYPWDVIAGLFDYQLTLVACLVGQGIVLQRFGLPVAIATGTGLTWAGFSEQFISPMDTHHLVFAFLVPATVMVGSAERFKTRTIPELSGLDGLEWIGRYPLTIYVTHYYFIALTTWLFRG